MSLSPSALFTTNILTSLILLSPNIPKTSAQSFDASTLLQTYTLHTGRQSACPHSLTYHYLAPTSRFIPSSNISADGTTCTGTGGKILQDGAVLLTQGLTLPSLLLSTDTHFFAGIESAPRVCGKWAFNTSATSWYLVNLGDEPVHDADSGIEIQPGYIYLIYEHFADLCVYITAPQRGIAASSAYQDPKDTLEEEAKAQVGSMACFSGDQIVYLEDGRSIPMHALRIGDRVQSSVNSTFSDIYAFSHYDELSVSTFLSLTTATGKQITLSPGHYVYLNGEPKQAITARVGHFVSLANGEIDRVVRIRSVRKKGIFNPHTLHGDIVVNGVLATTWTAALPIRTAAAALCPIRFMYAVVPQMRKYIHVLLPKLLALGRFHLAAEQ